VQMQIFSYLALVLKVPLLDLECDICSIDFIKKGEHGCRQKCRNHCFKLGMLGVQKLSTVSS
jgi:hypothetical protein